MAIDAQGADMARPFVEAANATFPTVIDRNNLLSSIFGFKAIPNAIFIDEVGIIRYLKYSGFDILKSEFKRIAETWVDSGNVPSEDSPSESNLTESETDHSKAVRLFDQGMKLYNQDKVEEALDLWRKGVELEPDNYVIRKQIWAVENPEKFYIGDVDYGWQKTQLEKGL